MSYDDYNDKHNFTFRFDSNDGERHLEMNVNELYLYDIFARFKEFLQGCGYEIHGEIEVVEYNSERDYDSGYTLTETPKHEPKFDFSNIPNNNWPFGGLTTEPIPALTTEQIAVLKHIDARGISTWKEWTEPKQEAGWSAELPTATGEKVRVQF